jgi:hypothetical protein
LFSGAAAGGELWTADSPALFPAQPRPPPRSPAPRSLVQPRAAPPSPAKLLPSSTPAGYTSSMQFGPSHALGAGATNPALHQRKSSVGNARLTRPAAPASPSANAGNKPGGQVRGPSVLTPVPHSEAQDGSGVPPGPTRSPRRVSRLHGARPCAFSGQHDGCPPFSPTVHDQAPRLTYCVGLSTARPGLATG